MRLAIDDQIIRESREFVTAWRDNDEELRIPSNEFGTELAYRIDVLLQVTEGGTQ